MGIFSFFSNKKKYKESQPQNTTKLYTQTGGTLIYADSAMQVSAFYRGVIYISTQLAKLPFNVKDSKNNIMDNHRIQKLLRTAPNPEMNTFMFRLVMNQSALIYGNGYAEIERDNAGRIIALWPISTNHIYTMRDANNTLIYRIVGGGIGGTGDAFLRKEDVFHLRNFHTKDGITGLGLIDYASEALGISKGADKFANALFSNGGLPAGVLTVDGKLSPEALTRIKESWEAAHSGRKVGGTAILEEGLTYSSISHDPQVLQFLESRKFSVLEIARFLGLPPTKLFDTEAATFNNIENANLEVATDTLDAWARNWECEADVKLLKNSLNGIKAEIDLQAVFRGDMKTRSEYFGKMMQVGAMTPNEIRESEGKSPYESGDRYYIATNNYTPADRVDEVVDSQIKGKDKSNEDDKDKKEIETALNKTTIEYLQRSMS